MFVCLFVFKKGHYTLAGEAQLLDVTLHTKRLGVRSPVRALMGSNQSRFLSHTHVSFIPFFSKINKHISKKILEGRLQPKDFCAKEK